MKTKLPRVAWGLLFSLCISYSSLFAQTQVSGTVLNAAGQALPAAAVLILNGTDSTLVKGQLSAVDGSYSIEGIGPGSYRLSVAMLGHTDYFSEPFTLDEGTRRKAMDPVVLQEKAEALDQVEVVAKRPLFEQKIDRLVVNVGSSITSAGSTALEVLQRSPGVVVNRGANLLGLSGRNGVLVMINGKESRLPISAIIQMLEGMNADNIERIELIHTPPANFDAEGNTGIINIVLKKNADDGFNGNYGANAGYGYKEKFGANANFNFRKNKANIFGDYSWTYDNNPQVFRQYRSFRQDGNIVENDSYSDRDPTKTHTQNGRVGLDLQLSPKTVLGALAGWMDRYWTMDAFNTVTMKRNGQPTGYIHIPNNEINHWRHYLGNLNLQHQFTKAQTLNLDLDYAHYYFTNPSNYANRFLDGSGNLLNETQLRVQKTTPMSILAAKADFTRTFGEKMTLESGLKGTMTRFDNDVLVEDLQQENWVRNPDYSADYGMEENIGAVYSALTAKLNEKTDLKAGLRYEYTHSNLGSAEQQNIVNRSYANLFPSLFLSRKINKDNTLQLSYSRRINRPNFMQLAPYFIFYDPSTVETGNPKLQPSITDAIKADYLWKSLQLSLQYGYDNEIMIQGNPEIDTVNNRQVNGALNWDYGKFYSATLSFPLHPTKWWDLQFNLNAQVQQFKEHGAKPVTDPAFVCFGYGSSSFRLPKAFSIELSGFFFTGGPFGQVVGQPIGEFNIGAQKDFGDHGLLRFNITDLFLTGVWEGRIDDEAAQFHYRGSYRQNERIFRLSYSRKFGSNKVKAARQRATGSEEERRRVN